MLCLAGPARAQKWVTAWAAADQGPYPVGNASAQPDLHFAFPAQDTGARDQTFRMVVKPSLWSNRVRLRFSNVFGAKPVTFDGVFTGLQASGAALMPGSNRPVSFAGKRTVTVQPGNAVWSDAVTLPWAGNPNAPELIGRKLAISFHVAGESGPMTWHAQAMQTSYMTVQDAGALGEFDDDGPFSSSTTSWFFLDALDVQAPPEIGSIICIGSGITDRTNSTLNGDDSWTDVLVRRLQAAGIHAAVASAAIAGNAVTKPAEYSATKPSPGGPSALDRLDRDVLSLSGVTHVIWVVGADDFGADAAASVAQVRDALAAGVKRIRQKWPKVKVIGATVPSTAGTTLEAFTGPDVEVKRKAFDTAIRNNAGLFDGVIDFDKATLDAQTGALRPEFVPDSTDGGPGDGLHPNRAGHLAMADAVDLHMLAGPAPPPRPKPKPAAPKPDEADPD